MAAPPNIASSSSDSLTGHSLAGESLSGASLSGTSLNGASLHGSMSGSLSGSLAGETMSGHMDAASIKGSGPDGPRLPAMPKIGLDEHVYAAQARGADERADRHAREAAKVGLYITLALRPKMSWRDKLRHFTHALNKHCHVGRPADHRVWSFYHDLAMLVKTHCGQEALRIASHEDDLYAARLAMGIGRDQIELDAEKFFDEVIGSGKECPEYMLPDDFQMIRMIRDQWI